MRLREELREDYRRMIYGDTRAAVEAGRTRVVKKWRLLRVIDGWQEMRAVKEAA